MNDRKFILKLLFIVIIGISIVVFILKFRQARNLVSTSQPEFHSKKLKPSSDISKNSSPTNPKMNQGENRLPSKESNLSRPELQRELLRGHLKDEPRKEPFDSGEKRTQQKPLFQLGPDLRFKGPMNQLKGQSYSELENVYAVPKEDRDQFDDILYVRGPYVIVRAEGPRPQSSLPTVFNHRTKRVAIVTGQIIIKFKDKETFLKRQNFFDGGESEVAQYPNILMAILSLGEAATLEDLKKRESFWGGLQGIKAAEVEVLESEILLK